MRGIRGVFAGLALALAGSSSVAAAPLPNPHALLTCSGTDHTFDAQGQLRDGPRYTETLKLDGAGLIVSGHLFGGAYRVAETAGAALVFSPDGSKLASPQVALNRRNGAFFMEDYILPEGASTHQFWGECTPPIF